MDTRKISPLWLLVILLLASCAGKITDAQFQDYTGTQVIATDTNYRIGILPSPAPVPYGDKNAIVVAMAVEGKELPMKLVELTSASLVSTNGGNYPVALVTGMNCWPERIDTKEAWYHMSVLPICGTGNPGVRRGKRHSLCIPHKEFAGGDYRLKAAEEAQLSFLIRYLTNVEGFSTLVL